MRDTGPDADSRITTPDLPTAGAPPPARAPIMVAGCWLLVLLVLGVGATFCTNGLAADFLRMQDRWLLGAILALAAITLAPLGGERLWRWGLLGRRGVVALAVGVAVVCYAGHYAVLAGYDLSRDEQMASFDAWIYAHGRWAWPMPMAWHDDYLALNWLFIPPISHPATWVSAYLPGNALLRAGGMWLGDAALVNPLLSGGAVLALWAVARRLWPEAQGDAARGDAALAVALLVLSGQFLFTGMTSYAMPAHLLCNLVWLWLFLADRRRLDLLAIVLGFVGTGLHQPLFHPLFVAPWLAVLLYRRQWRRLALFVAGYGAIGLFWLIWPNALTVPLMMSPDSTRIVGTGIVARIVDTLANNQQNLSTMAANLLRFCTWQSLALVPLLIAGLWATARNGRRDPAMIALAVGFFAPVVFMVLVLPYQGHGFGYRYLHPLLGNAALLAVHGWRWLAPWRGRLRPVLVRALLASAVVLLPMQAWLAHRLYAPFARANARIDATPADYVIIGAGDGPYALDLVLNRPDLSNRPIRLSATDIDDSDRLAAHLCHGGATMALATDGFFDAADAVFGTAPTHAASQRYAADAAQYGDAGCRIIPLR